MKAKVEVNGDVNSHFLLKKYMEHLHFQLQWRLKILRILYISFPHENVHPCFLNEVIHQNASYLFFSSAIRYSKPFFPLPKPFFTEKMIGKNPQQAQNMHIIFQVQYMPLKVLKEWVMKQFSSAWLKMCGYSYTENYKPCFRHP